MANRKRANPIFRMAAIYPYVNLQPLIKIQKIDAQHSAQKNEISNFQNDWLFHRWGKLQYYIERVLK